MAKDIFDRILDDEYLRLVEVVRSCEELLLAEQSRLEGAIWQISDICVRLSNEIKNLNYRVTEIEQTTNPKSEHAGACLGTAASLREQLDLFK